MSRVAEIVQQYLAANEIGNASARGIDGLIVPQSGLSIDAPSGPLPGSTTRTRDDQNATRLIAIWTYDTPFIDAVRVDWRFDEYGDVFQPTEDDRHPDTFPGRAVYEYRPNPNGPFKRGIFKDRRWEAWSVTAPSEDVETAEIQVSTVRRGIIVMLGGAIVRNGVLTCSDGPTAGPAHCFSRFK